MRILKNVLTVTLASALVLVAFPAAAVVGSWSTPAEVSLTAGDAYDPQVTVDSTGLATAVWWGSNGSVFLIQSSTSQSGGTWSSPVDVSLTGGDALDPQLTVDSTGLVTAVWYRFDGSTNIIQSSTSQSGGAWSAPVSLSATGANAFAPQVTVDSTGLVTAVWYGGNRIIQSSTSQSGGAWSSPVDLSVTGRDAFAPQITVDSTGLVTAVWYRFDGSRNIIQSSSSQSGGAWSSPVDLSATGQNALYPQLTVSSTDLVTVVWYRSNGSHTIIQSSTSQSGGAWSSPTPLSAIGASAIDPQLTVDSTGLVTAVWTRFGGSNDIIQSSTSQSGGAWSTPADLSATGGNASEPQVTVSSTGLATALWARSNGSQYIIQSSTSQSGGAWSSPIDLSATGGDALAPEVTVSSAGLFTAVWHRSNGIVSTIQASTFENSNPTTTPTTPPTTASTLATTGAEVEWLALGSLIAVVAGAGFFALGRRKRA